ncbi:hypothetical protein N0V85_000208 [Neurospora sp. IMI 360204]|nr:hypothetical protein N0V85_000208 [Neurospora sp. IMI 360204]
MPSPSDIPPGNNAFNSINNSKANNTNDMNEAIDVTTRTPTPDPWVPLSRRHNSPSPSLSNQEQDEIFNRISSSMSHSSTLAARQEPIAAGLPTSPGRHILRRARIAGGRRSQSAARDVVELLVSGSDAGEDEDEDELLFLQTPSPNPNPNYSSSSRVGTTTTITGSITDMLLGTITAEEQAVVSRTWKKVLKSRGRGVTTTQHGNVEAVAEEGEGKNNGNEDGGSEGGAVLLWNKVTMQGEEEEEDEQGEEDSDSDGDSATTAAKKVVRTEDD